MKAEDYDPPLPEHGEALYHLVHQAREHENRRRALLKDADAYRARAEESARAVAAILRSLAKLGVPRSLIEMAADSAVPAHELVKLVAAFNILAGSGCPVAGVTTKEEESMADQKPSVGRIVHYVLRAEDVNKPASEGGHRAAIVTAAFGGSLANLTVFLDGSNDGPPRDSTGNLRVYSRDYSDAHDPGTWHWPEN